MTLTRRDNGIEVALKHVALRNQPVCLDTSQHHEKDVTGSHPKMLQVILHLYLTAKGLILLMVQLSS